MTHLQSIELSVCFGLSAGAFLALTLCNIKFAIDHFREKRKKKAGDADVER